MRFEDVLEIKNGRNQKAVENPQGKYPIYGSGGIMGYADDYICEADTVVVGRKGSINNPLFVEEPFWNVDTAFGLQANRDLLFPRYLYYFCKHFDFERLNKAVTIPSLTKSDLLKIEIDLPDLRVQRSIVAKLASVESIMRLRKQQLAELDNLVKARFVEMFGDPVHNDKGWPMAPLASLAEIKIGPFGSLLHKDDYVSGGHALVNPSHIIDGQIVTDDDLTVTDKKYAEMEAYHLRTGDIVLGRRGEMGRCAVVYNDGLLCGTGSLIIRPAAGMLPYFLQKIISYPTFKEFIEDMAVGVTMMNLNVPIVSNFMIPVLPLDEQKAYLRFVEQTYKSKAVVQQALNEAQTLFDSLMQQYFG